jgi:hypothetical protein
MMSDYEAARIAVEEKKAVEAGRIADALFALAEATADINVGNQRCIAPALENISGAIANRKSK